MNSLLSAKQATLKTAKIAADNLSKFIGQAQLRCLLDSCKGEEKDYFINVLAEKAALVNGMPKTYDQDGLGDSAVVYLHYFKGSCDWYITEKDMGDGSADQTQHQAFGLAVMNGEAELGYISINEIIQCGVELDLYWEPTTLGSIKQKLRGD